MTTNPFVTATDSLSSAPSDSPKLGLRPRWVAWTDGLGMLASIGCAIHCAAMPFVIAYLPALGQSFLAGESFHQAMAISCFIANTFWLSTAPVITSRQMTIEPN